MADVDVGDVLLSGPATCNNPDIALQIGVFAAGQILARFTSHLCGAPGPALFTTCN